MGHIFGGSKFSFSLENFSSKSIFLIPVSQHISMQTASTVMLIIVTVIETLECVFILPNPDFCSSDLITEKTRAIFPSNSKSKDSLISFFSSCFHLSIMWASATSILPCPLYLTTLSYLFNIQILDH